MILEVLFKSNKVRLIINLTYILNSTSNIHQHASNYLLKNNMYLYINIQRNFDHAKK